MRIAHISDLHIRNFRYRSEYRIAFARLYSALKELRPHLIINTGDTVHSKLSVSPELFADVTDHCVKVSEIAPYWLILGNHDLNLKNPNRSDAISPVVDAIRGRTNWDVNLIGPGKLSYVHNIDFWHYDIRGEADCERFEVDDARINIGLYHGSIRGCSTDSGFTIEDAESDIDRFKNMDYVLMGDIHKRQSFRGGTMAYPGSLIQQNYGEELHKGFLVWDIRGKSDFDVNFVPIEVPGRFFTAQIGSDLDISSIDIPKRSRVRVIVEKDITPSQRWDIERRIRAKIEPIEFICSDSAAARGQSTIEITTNDRDKFLDDWLQERKIDQSQKAQLISALKAYESLCEERNIGGSWRLSTLGWSDMMNFGADNIIDMKKLSGLVGIFASNGSGKSSIFDILLQTLFDKVTKEVPRNVDLINDNKQIGKMIAEFEADDKLYTVERTIERLQYGQKKNDVKQWGKTSLDFSVDGVTLNGATRPETERSIRAVVGNFDDFTLTSMISQGAIFGLPGGGDIINCKEADRRRIMFRFLDLEIYEQINAKVKEDIKELSNRKSTKNRDSIVRLRDELIRSKDDIVAQISDLEPQFIAISDSLSTLRNQILAIESAPIDIMLDEYRDTEKSIDFLESESRRIDRGIKSSKAKLEDLATKIDSHVAMRPQAPDRDAAVIKSAIESLKKDCELTRAKLEKAKDAQIRGKRSLKTLDDIPCERKFPSCKFISDAVSFVAAEETIAESIRTLEASLERNVQELRSLESYEIMHISLVKWERDLELLRADTNAVDVQVDLYSEQLRSTETEIVFKRKQLTELEQKMRESSTAKLLQLREDQRQIQVEFNSIKSNVDEKNKELGGICSRIQALDDDLIGLETLDERLQVLELLSEMVGKNGLPYKILSGTLPLINAQIAKILSGIVKFSVFFADDQENQTIGLYIRYNDYKSRPLGLGGGAERFIASIAVRVALLSVSSLPKTDMLIIDEGFGRLDGEHLESLQRMFEYLRTVFTKVFVISHVDFMKDLVDHTIEINTIDGYAKVEVI